MYDKVEKDEEKLKKDLGIFDNESDEFEKDINLDNDWFDTQKKLCELMTEVIESSSNIQRKSFLINQKCTEILHIENYGIKSKSSLYIVLIILFYIILFIFEMPYNVYDKIPKNMRDNFFGCISIPVFSTIFYFFIFNYAIIKYKYISGDLIFGENFSENVNFYKFICFVLRNCDVAFYHAIWVLKKFKNEKNDDYNFSPYYFDVFDLPEIKGFKFIPHITLAIILVSIFNATKFSNFKIKKKQVVLFNENADFFYNEKNLYSNFILGCLMLIKFKKTLDKISEEKNLLK